MKVRKPALDLAVYVAVRVVVCVLQAVPIPVAVAFAELLAKLAYRVNRRHREVARENLAHAFPEKTPAAVDDLVRGCYRHFCLLLVEIVLLPRKMVVSNWRRSGSVVGGDKLMRALLSDRPVLVVTAHFGNWELAGFAMGVFGFQSHAIARVLDNPHLERFLKRFRQATGQTMIAKKDDFDRLTGVLQGGGIVATLADQDAGPRGVFVNFFGRPASAHKAVALMAVEFNALMVVCGVPRVGGFLDYQIVTEEVIDPLDYAGRGDAVKALTQAYHTVLERLIRRHPEQYFWLHRRWKTTPAVRKQPLARAA